VSRSVRPVVSLLWRRGDLAALLALLAVWAVVLSWQAVHRSADLAEPPAVEEKWVESTSQRIDPNTASVASLRRLPQVGAVRAEAIVRYRQAASRPGRPAFVYLEDLQSVPRMDHNAVLRMESLVSLPPRGDEAATKP
jgi:DNA uptake protein ComE-like DNA-binding protein